MKKKISFLLLFVIFFSGCAATKYQFEYQDQVHDKVWPPAPEMPRLRYLGVIQGEENFKKIEGSEGVVRKSVNWLGRLLLGEALPKRLYRPQSGVVDEENERLYVTDVGAKSVFVFDLKKGALDLWEAIDGTEFLTPIAICLLGGNQIFVTDADLGYVLKFDENAENLIRIGDDRLLRPTGIACDKQNKKIYVADSQAHSIHVFSSNGEHLFEFGAKGSKNGSFNSPTHLSFSNNKLYVSDTLNARVQVFNADGAWLSSFGKRGMYVGNLPRPKGVAIDSENHVYVVESYYDHLLVFNEAGRELLPVGGSGGGAGKFNLPAGIWIDRHDVIYVADMFNRRIMVFQYIGLDNS